MAQRRMISSEIWRNDFFNGLSFLGRLLWIGLVVTCADDQGRLRNHPRLIRSDIFPLDDVTAEEIERMIEEFSRAGCVVMYEAGGKSLLQIVNWWQYQTSSWASPSKYPPPPGWTDRIKYHTAANKIVILNWDARGGFQPQPAGEMAQDSLPGGGRSPGDNLSSGQNSSLGSSLGDSVGSGLDSSVGNSLSSALNDDDVKDECEDESTNPLAFFNQMQSIVEEITGLPVVGMESIATINELCAMRATREDIKGGYDWLVQSGRTYKYIGQLIGPTLTEIANRVQASRDSPGRVKTYIGPDGEKLEVPA